MADSTEMRVIFPMWKNSADYQILSLLMSNLTLRSHEFSVRELTQTPVD